LLGTDGGSFDAKVLRDDRPVADATVVLLPTDASLRNRVTVLSDEADGSGHVALEGVPPSDYLVITWEKIEEGDWFDPAPILTSYLNRLLEQPYVESVEPMIKTKPRVDLSRCGPFLRTGLCVSLFAKIRGLGANPAGIGGTGGAGKEVMECWLPTVSIWERNQVRLSNMRKPFAY